jgi:hypothetical protein
MFGRAPLYVLVLGYLAVFFCLAFGVAFWIWMIAAQFEKAVWAQQGKRTMVAAIGGLGVLVGLIGLIGLAEWLL